MAARTKKIRRRFRRNATSDQMTHTVGDLIEADELLAQVDLEDDGRLVVEIRIREADHAGVMAEFDAGLVTTLTAAALDTEVQAYDRGDEIRNDFLTATQRSALIARATTWPAP